MEKRLQRPIKKDMISKDKENERDFIIKCIELYKSLPVLWKVKSEGYTDRNKKAQAYETLLKFYNIKFPNATRLDLTKKFNSLRTNFRKELKKINDSQKLGQETYESNLWYFESMKFLIDQESTNDSLKISEDECDGSVNDFLKIDHVENSVSNSPRKKRPLPRDELIRLACTRLQEPLPYELQLATTWATELIGMTPQQQLFAKKFINEIMFEGQMGTLHRNSMVINDGPARINNNSQSQSSFPSAQSSIIKIE